MGRPPLAASKIEVAAVRNHVILWLGGFAGVTSDASKIEVAALGCFAGVTSDGEDGRGRRRRRGTGHRDAAARPADRPPAARLAASALRDHRRLRLAREAGALVAALRGQAPLGRRRRCGARPRRRRARLFFHKGCEYCHQVAGQGGVRGPVLDRVGLRLRRAQLETRILAGGNNMPAYAGSLREPDLQRLLEFLQSRSSAVTGQRRRSVTQSE